MSMTRKPGRNGFWSGAVLACGLLAWSASRADAQYFMPYGYGYTGFYVPPVNFGAVNFGVVNFGAVNFGAVNFGLVNFGNYVPYAFGGYYGPYYYYNPWYALANRDMAYLQQASLNSARYNLLSAESATSYQASNLMAQAAMDVLRDNSVASYNGVEGRFNVRTGRPKSFGEPVAGDIPLKNLISRNGEVLWPLNSPVGGDLYDKRREAGRAIQSVIQTFKTNGKVPIDQAIAARNRLSDYTEPALNDLKRHRPNDIDNFLNFVASLDRGVRNLVGEEKAESLENGPTAPGNKP